MYSSRWSGVPIGDPHWRSMAFDRTILIVARTLGTTSWMLDLLPEVVADARVQLVFTCEEERPSVYVQGTVDLLHALRIPVIPWEQALSTRFDLAIAASHTGDLEQLTCPLLMLPHGAGFGKTVSAPPGGRVPTPNARLRIRDVPAVTAVISHEDQARYFDPTANDIELLVAGDPVMDRLRASERFRDDYRRSMGLFDNQRLVTLSSTWGGTSQFSTEPDLSLRLLAELPCDQYKVAVILHPNIWIGHSAWQVRLWLRRSIEAGLMLVPPRDSWRAAVVASDLLVADHGSVIFYAAALGKPILLASFAEDELLPDTPFRELARTSPRLDRRRLLRPQVEAAIDEFDPAENLVLADRLFARPGRSLRIIQEAIYRLIDLPMPETEPRVLAVEPPQIEHQPVLSHVVFGGPPLSSSESPPTFAIERLPACALVGGGGGGGGGGVQTSDTWPWISDVPIRRSCTAPP